MVVRNTSLVSVSFFFSAMTMHEHTHVPKTDKADVYLESPATSQVQQQQ